MNHTTTTLPFETRSDIRCLALSPNGSMLITIDVDGYALLVNFTKRVVLSHFNFKGRVYCITFSPDGKFFAVGMHKKVEVWKSPELEKEFSPFRLHKTYIGHYDKVCSVQWTNDSKYFITGSLDGTSKVFSLNLVPDFIPATFSGISSKVVTAFFGKSNTDAFTLNRNGVFVHWKWKTFEQQNREKEAKTKMDFQSNDDGSLFAVPNLEEEEDLNETTLFVPGKGSWSLYKKRIIALEQKSYVTSCTMFGAEVMVVGFSIGVFGFYSLPNLNIIHTLSIARSKLTTIAINSTGEWIAFGSAKFGQLLVWEWKSETFILKQQGHSLDMNCVAFSPNGQLIATGGDDGKVKIWNVSNGFCFVTFSDHTAPVTDICFTQNGLSVISSSLDGTLRAYDLIRYRNYRTLKGPSTVPFTCFAIDPSSEVVAAGSTETFDIYMWSLQTGKYIETFSGHTGPVSDLCFNPQGTTLASVSWDKTARLWDIFSRKNQRQVYNHQSDVLSVAFSPNGKILASSDLSGVISFWDIDNDTPLFSIEGRRDCSGGRLFNDARTAKNSAFGKAFTSICFSTDGTCILAGGNSKYICLYEITQQLLLRKFTISQNRSFDGVLEYLNSSQMTEAGPLAGIDHSDSDNEDEKQKRIPGATRGDKGQRKTMPIIRCKSVCFCPSSRNFAAATTEGCVVYSIEDVLNSSSVFDPLQLGVDVTPSAVKEACDNKEHLRALTLSLRLNEADIKRFVFESIPPSEIQHIVTNLPVFFLQPFLDFLATQFATSVYFELCLLWWTNISFVFCEHLRRVGTEAQSCLRAIHKAIAKHSDVLFKLSNTNQYKLEYLKNASRINKQKKENIDVEEEIENEKE